MYYLVKENNEFFVGLFHFELKNSQIRIHLKYVKRKNENILYKYLQFRICLPCYTIETSRIEFDLFRLSLK